MDAYEMIEKRRTVRAFKKSASDEHLNKIILAGTKALSAMNSQPWEFIIVDKPELVDQIADQKYQQNSKITPRGEKTSEDIKAAALVQKKAYDNCSVIAVCHKSGYENALSMWSCIQNMALAATIEGLGVVPSTFWEEHQANVEKLLGLPDGYSLATVMLVGVQQGEPKEKELRSEFSWLHRNQFGNNQ